MKSPTQATRAVCLFSGGLDSTTVLYDALRRGYHVTALTVSYGQRHAREIESARRILQPLGVRSHEITIEMPWGGSSLTDSSLAIPQALADPPADDKIPSTYVPARNTIFLSLAGSLAEALEAQVILIGANAVDYSGYPDCRPDFLSKMEQVLATGTRAGVNGHPLSIEAPLIKLSKKEIVLLAQSLGVPLEWTWSCYDGGTRPCGVCDSCGLRKKGFLEAGLQDPGETYEVSSKR